jgi:hypothetical protein
MAEKMIDLKDLKVNEQNPRRISDSAFDRLKKSVKRDSKFMELRPIIVDEDNNIIGGNQRYRALAEIGRRKIPASWVRVAEGLTEKQKRRFVILDNSPEGMSGYWDFDLLQESYDKVELERLGFSFLADIDLDFEEEWRGLPEFIQEDKVDDFLLSIRVNFSTEEDLRRFSEAIGQTITEYTKTIWYPKRDQDQNNREMEYTSES